MQAPSYRILHSLAQICVRWGWRTTIRKFASSSLFRFLGVLSQKWLVIPKMMIAELACIRLACGLALLLPWWISQVELFGPSGGDERWLSRSLRYCRFRFFSDSIFGVEDVSLVAPLNKRPCSRSISYSLFHSGIHSTFLVHVGETP